MFEGIGKASGGSWAQGVHWKVGFVLVFAFTLFATQAPAAVVQVQTATGVTNGGLSVSATYPATPSAGNLLVAVAGNYNGSASPTVPPGWITAIYGPSHTPGQSIYYKIAGSSEPTVVTISDYPLGFDTRLGLHIYEYSGIDAGDPLDVTIMVDGFGTSISPGGVTTTASSSLIIAAFISNVSTSALSWTDSFLEQNDFTNGGQPASQATYAGAHLITGSAGTYTTTATTDADGNWRAQIVAFNAVPPPVTEYVVTNTNDSGVGSLRAAIDYANLNAGTTISFDIPDTDLGYQTDGTDHWWRIAPGSVLPTVAANGTIIDGSTQTANRGDVNTRGPEIELYGAGAGTDGLIFTGGNSILRGLVINSFPTDGVKLLSTFNTIEGCYIGTNAIGTSGLGNGARGIDVANANNTIGGLTAAARNVISGNVDDGIVIYGSSASFNKFTGNYIGLNSLGTAAIGNTKDGIAMGGGANNNSVGGTVPAERNVISGNVDGVEIDDDSDSNKITGNYIGTDVTGMSPVPNLRHGVVIYSGPSETQVGGAVAGQGNVISGNTEYGLVLDGNSASLTTNNTIAGNYIGVDKNGTGPLGNTIGGIQLFGGAHTNIIGGAGAGNVISSNSGSGIKIQDANTDDNIVIGNFVGTNSAGTADLGNTTDGIVIAAGAQGNRIGGTAAGERNIIAGNDNDGIWITGTNTSSNTVQGNWIGIGTDDSALGNTYHGIGIEWDASDNTIGGTTAGAGNRIGHSLWDGVAIANGTGSGNAVLGNSIFSSGDLGIDIGNDGVTNNDGDDETGLNETQNFPVLDVVATDESSQITIIGTLNSSPAMTFRIEFFSNSVADVSGNGEGETYIGTTNVVTGGGGDGGFTVSFPLNAPVGTLFSATATDPGGNTSEFSANIAAVSAHELVVDTTSDILDGTTSSIAALLSYPGPDGFISLREAIIAANNTPNGTGPDGIGFDISGAGPHTIQVGNVADGDNGIYPAITEAVTIDGTTEPNFLTTPIIELDGQFASAGDANGLTIETSGVTIRGLVINRFDDDAIEIDIQGGNNTIVGNYLGTDVTGLLRRDNLYGITIKSDGNTIGGTNDLDRNVIAGNTSYGLGYWQNATGNNVYGNYIGVGADGSTALGNADGILFQDGATNNTVGGAALGAGNVISGNTQTAIGFTADAGPENSIVGNYIGVAFDGTTAVPNLADGITVRTSDTKIGGDAGGEGNIIANHTAATSVGVWVTDGSTGVSILGNSIYNNNEDGISLGPPYGPVPNDAGDDDTGNNNLQNYPVLSTATTDLATQLIVDGTLDTDGTNQDYRIEFFRSTIAMGQDASGYGEGQDYLGFTTATTDVSGYATFNKSLTANVALGEFITATATVDNGDGTYGDTSQFAANILAAGAASFEISGTVFEDVDFAGTAFTYDGGAVDVALANVDVELYSGADAYLASATTAGDGTFSFTSLSEGVYKVRVRSATIGDADTPPAGGLHPSVPATWPYPLADMTWGHGVAAIGGQDTGGDDTATADNAGPGDTWVAVTVSSGDVSGLNFGFSYDLIVNEDDDANADNLRSKQGTLRQFIKNSNAIVGVSKSWFQIPSS